MNTPTWEEDFLKTDLAKACKPWELALIDYFSRIEQEAREDERRKSAQEIEAMKEKHDIETDPGGAWNVCLSCDKRQVNSGEYCESAYNGTLDAVVVRLKARTESKSEGVN